MTKEDKHFAEQENAILFKTKKDPEEAIGKFKLDAEQAKAILKKNKEAAKKQNY